MLTHAPVWMDLEMALSQSSSDSKTNTAWFHSYEALRVVKLMETESGEVTAGAREGGLRGTVSAGEINDELGRDLPSETERKRRKEVKAGECIGMKTII